jgi:hypothetical protein
VIVTDASWSVGLSGTSVEVATRGFTDEGPTLLAFEIDWSRDGEAAGCCGIPCRVGSSLILPCHLGASIYGTDADIPQHRKQTLFYKISVVQPFLKLQYTPQLFLCFSLILGNNEIHKQKMHFTHLLTTFPTNLISLACAKPVSI